MSTIFAYSIQHAGRTGKRLGDMGVEHGPLSEALCNRFVAYGAFDHHRRKSNKRPDGTFNHYGIVMSHGAYAEQHGWCNRSGVAAYHALHLNAVADPKPGYGLYLYDPQTTKAGGQRLAEMLADAASGFFEALFGERYSIRAIPATQPDWGNAYHTIKGLGRPIGVCHEPIFLSNPRHRRLFCKPAVLARYGTMVAEVSERWADDSTNS